MRFYKKIALLCLVCYCSFSLSFAETVVVNANTPKDILHVLSIAQKELGTTETKDGTTKYGTWAGDPKAQWCAEFLCWCVNEADTLYGTHLLETIYPKYSGQNVGRNWFLRHGRYIDRVGRIPSWGTQWYWQNGEYLKNAPYVPKTGDFMFLGYEGNFNTSHVALVEGVTQTKDGIMVHVIEGNNPDKVQRNTYPLNKQQILGYGVYSNHTIGTTMRVGNDGAVVEQFQKQLATLNLLDEEHITAVFDNHTANAVRNIQLQNAWLTNGIADFRVQKWVKDKYEHLMLYTPEDWLVGE